MRINCIVLLLSMLFILKINGQDVYQTQYFNNLILINPAYTGVMDEHYRLGLNYRSQWFNPLQSQGYKTGIVNGEMKTNISENDYYGLGMTIGTDQMGISKFKQTFVYGSGSYIKQIGGSKGKDVYLIGGVKFGGIQYSYDESQLWFGNQFNTNSGTINANLPSGESTQLIGNNNTGLTPDLGIGISGYQSGDKVSYYGGLAVDHITRPKIKIGSGEDLLPMKWSVNAGANVRLNPKVQLLPSVLWVNHIPHNMILPSLQFRFSNLDDDEIAFRAGVLSKFVSDAAGNAIESWSLLTMLEYHQFVVGLSYEFTTSGLGGYNDNSSAFELSMNYRFAEVEKRTSINCPNF